MEGIEKPEETSPAGTQKLAGTANWGPETVFGIFAGMLYGGSKEAAASASKDAEVTLKLGSTSDKREQYRLMRDTMEKRFIRVTRGSIVGGVRLGMFAALSMVCRICLLRKEEFMMYITSWQLVQPLLLQLV